MSEKIEPALTPDQWGKLMLDADAWVGHDDDPEPGAIFIAGDWKSPEERHAIAALCLHGQPFGVTREDVEMLRAAEETAKTALDRFVNAYTAATALPNRLADLRARIEALLPPEGT